MLFYAAGFYVSLALAKSRHNLQFLGDLGHGGVLRELADCLNRNLLIFHALYPTLPSRLTPSSFWASTANSMGSSLKTSLQKPLTIMFTASWVARPRCLQ